MKALPLFISVVLYLLTTTNQTQPRLLTATNLNLSSAQMAAKVDGLEPFKNSQTGEVTCPNLADGTPQVRCCNSNGTDCKCATHCGSWPW